MVTGSPATSLLDQPSVSAALIARHGDLLAVAGETSPWSPSLQIAAALAAQWQASLTGCYVAPALRDLGGADSEPAVTDLRPSPVESDGEHAAAFRAFAREQGVPQANWTVARSGLARTLRQLGAWHSLALLPRDLIDEPLQVEILGEVLLTCRLPVLLLPPAWRATPRFDRVMVAWDGSLEATRALRAALPFLVRAHKVVLLDGRRPVDEACAFAPAFDPFLYLSRHGVDADPVYAGIPLRTAGAALLDRAQQAHADLLVMGAFGHSRLRERVIGGATRHVLQHGSLPVLMQH